MLLNLRIRNFAIIDAVELDFPAGFTVVTGETGAGKSILIDALGLVLAGRANTDIVRAGAEAAEVEALFDISKHPVVCARLEQRDLVGDDHETLLIRRVISSKGRGKVLINGRLSTVATLAHMIAGLVDISGQHHQQSLLIVDNHLDILDTYAATIDKSFDAAKARYRGAFENLRALRKEQRDLGENEQLTLQRADYLRFQLEEIERLQPQEGEDVVLEESVRRLAHAEKLRAGSQLAEGLLYSEDGSAFDKIGKAAAELESLARIDSELQGTSDGLAGARREIEEAARKLQRYAEGIESDPQRLEEEEDRLAALRQLCRKHGMELGEVITHAASLAQELEGLENVDARLASLGQAVEEASVAAEKCASKLSKARQVAAKELGTSVGTELSEMDLGDACFAVHLHSLSELSASGAETAEFLWSANPGEPEKPLAKIASGGELSRLMLAVKSVLASRDLVSLYVFDEVDSGLGGRAADSIGRKIQKVAQGHQAITITHLAPIAARAEHHLCVTKSVVGERTLSHIEILEPSTRANEIARMIDGASITDVTRKAAKEMLGRR